MQSRCHAMVRCTLTLGSRAVQACQVTVAAQSQQPCQPSHLTVVYRMEALRVAGSNACMCVWSRVAMAQRRARLLPAARS